MGVKVIQVALQTNMEVPRTPLQDLITHVQDRPIGGASILVCGSVSRLLKLVGKVGTL